MVGNTNKIMKIVKGKGKNNQFQIVTVGNNNGPVSNPYNTKPLTPTNSDKINYFNYNSNKVDNKSTSSGFGGNINLADCKKNVGNNLNLNEKLKNEKFS